MNHDGHANKYFNAISLFYERLQIKVVKENNYVL